MLQLRRAQTMLRLAVRRLAIKARGFPIDDEPHFCEAGKALFANELATTETYLEYGSGGSTVTAHHAAEALVSVDNDRDVLRAVGARLRRHAYGPTAMLIYVDMGITKEWGYPVFHRRTRVRVERWKNYAQAPWGYLNERQLQPDMIMVDGRFRVACILESLLNLHPVSSCRILVDDYTERHHYHVVERFAELHRVSGRMALLTKRRDMDIDECRHFARSHYADSR
jgi:hypothetical protein